MSTVATREFVPRPAKKSIGTFVSQGSAGGAISIFLVVLVVVFRQPNGYNFLLIPYIPVILIIGSVFGAGGGVLNWLIDPIFKFRFGALVRSIVTVGVIALIFVVSEFRGGSPLDVDLLGLSLVTAGVIGLPSTILFSSNISLWWLVLFGSDRFAAAGWLSLLAGFVLRAASLAGLLISLFFLAWWGSFLSLDWGVSLNPYYIGIAILYFAASSYFAIRPPRGLRLIVTALLLNVPLSLCAFNLVSDIDPDTRFLGIIIFVFLGLWTAFAICFLFDAGFHARSENRPLDTLVIKGCE